MHQVVQELLAGDNFHFGCPLLKWQVLVFSIFFLGKYMSEFWHFFKIEVTILVRFFLGIFGPIKVTIL